MKRHFRTHLPRTLDEALLKTMAQKKRAQKHSFLHRNEWLQFSSLAER